MKVSFIVICYNGQDVIYNCLRSILATPYSDGFEIIYVDDASSDSSFEIVESIAATHDNITILRNKDNRGRAYSRNKGIAKAAGEYICFVDADDFVLSLNLGEILPKLVSGNDLVVAGRMDYSLKNRKFFYLTNQTYLFTGLKFLQRASDFPACFSDNFITGKFIKKDLLNNNKILFKTDRRNAEDIFFSTLVWMHSHNIYFTPSPFYIYGRGNYKASFGIEKCEDVLINCKDLLRYREECISPHEKIILSNKYVKTVFETMKRADGVIDEVSLVNIFEKHYVDVSQYYSELIYTADVIKRFVRLCNNGLFSKAYYLATK